MIHFIHLVHILCLPLTAYIPFNLVKGSVVTIVYLLLKPKMKYLEL